MLGDEEMKVACAKCNRAMEGEQYMGQRFIYKYTCKECGVSVIVDYREEGYQIIEE